MDWDQILEEHRRDWAKRWPVEHRCATVRALLTSVWERVASGATVVVADEPVGRTLGYGDQGAGVRWYVPISVVRITSAMDTEEAALAREYLANPDRRAEVPGLVPRW